MYTTLTNQEAGVVIGKSFDRFSLRYYADNRDEFDQTLQQAIAKHGMSDADIRHFISVFFAALIDTLSRQN